MSTWIFDPLRVKTTFGLLMVTGLLACNSTRLSGVSPSSEPSTTVTVSGRNLVIEGPSGFCVDKQVSQLSEDSAFVLLGNCAVVSRTSRAVQPKIKALLTATVSAPPNGTAAVTDSVKSMDRFLRSETGRTALSRDSDPGTVKILETFHNDGTFYLRASDTSQGIVPGAAADYWRAYFDLQDQIVSISVIGFESTPLSPDVSLATLQEFADLIRDPNGIATKPVAVARTPTVVKKTQVEVPTTKKGKPFWTFGILRRIIK